MRAGRRDTPVVLERFTSTADAYNEPVETWASIGREMAEVYFSRGDERRRAAMEQGEEAATFKMLATARTRGLTVRDRLQALGRVWNVRGSVPRGRTEIEVTAVAVEAAVTPAPPASPGQFDFSDADNSGLLALILEDA